MLERQISFYLAFILDFAFRTLSIYLHFFSIQQQVSVLFMRSFVRCIFCESLTDQFPSWLDSIVIQHSMKSIDYWMTKNFVDKYSNCMKKAVRRARLIRTYQLNLTPFSPLSEQRTQAQLPRCQSRRVF